MDSTLGNPPDLTVTLSVSIKYSYGPGYVGG